MILSVDRLKGGEILLEAIRDSCGEVIVPCETCIREEYIPLIKSLSIETVSIKESDNQSVQYKTIIQNEKIEYLVAQIKDKMENHIYKQENSLKKFEVIAREIVKEIERLPYEYQFDLFERNSDLYEHSVYVALYSVALAKKIGIHKREILCDIAIGCLLHDIGLRYITIPFQNRDMNEMESSEQFEYKKHTILGYTAVESEPWISELSKKMILYHHENQAGTGFPMKTKNKDMVCQIIQLTDWVDRTQCGIECLRMNSSLCIKEMILKKEKEFKKELVENFLELINIKE